MGRTIRNKNDYSFVVFADHRFDRVDNHGKLPVWIETVIVRLGIECSNYLLLIITFLLKWQSQQESNSLRIWHSMTKRNLVL